MIEYKAVPSGLEIARRIADCLEASAPRGYEPDERPRAIQKLNDILQGRSARSVDDLLAELDKCEDPRLPAVLEDVRAFLRQKELLTMPYVKRAGRQPFTFQHRPVSEGRKLKIIDQQLYDRAAKEGFPVGFFSKSYFDHVTFYCLPDYVDLSGSELHGCKFAVCRIKGVTFGCSRIYDNTSFQSSLFRLLNDCRCCSLLT